MRNENLNYLKKKQVELLKAVKNRIPIKKRVAIIDYLLFAKQEIKRIESKPYLN